MELLARTRPRLAVAAGLAGLTYLGGCMLVDALVQTERPFAFDHRVHVEDEGLDCADCHSRWEDSDDPGLPLPAQCALCHAEIDADKPPERQVATLFDGDRFRATRSGRLPDEVIFPHRAHATRGLECLACHAEVAADDGRGLASASLAAPDMEACLACHDASGGPRQAQCGACHLEIRADVAPASHAADWRHHHGTLVRAHSEERSDRCTLCHERSSCESCHQLEPPRSHDNFWRRRGHGLAASMDRQSCATCHDSDSCARCHSENRPLGHGASFGAPRDRHCLSCHEPLREESCSACHQATVSHALATPLPANHLPGMNCRQCHGNGQPLPHVDNGQLCTSCHR